MSRSIAFIAVVSQVIALYPGKEVRKGLDAMYKKVDRHLSDDAYLLDVVWRNLQDEFVKQYVLWFFFFCVCVCVCV